MKCSVVLAAYKGEAYLTQQLESILAQTVQPDEVLLCDDGSTDGTVALIEDFLAHHQPAGWRLLRNETNVGYCHNFYRGIADASGDIIFLSDQDDVWHPQKIEKMLEAMEANPDLMALSHRYDVIDAAGEPLKDSGVHYLGDRFDGSLEEITVDSLIGCSYVRGFSMCFRSQLKAYLKPIDLQSMLSHDWYLCMLAAMTGRCCFLNLDLGSYRYHGGNTSLSTLSRKTLIGDREKRKQGLKESIEAHSYLLGADFGTLGATDRANIARQIQCEKKRLRFLEGRNPFVWLGLLRYRDCYERYYKFASWARVWLGDFCYAYGINWKK